MKWLIHDTSENRIIPMTGKPVVETPVKRKQKSRCIREIKSLLIRFGGKCFYCSKELQPSEGTRDHLVPKSKGGPRSIFNMVPSCRKCNTIKGDRLPTEEEKQRAKEIHTNYHGSTRTFRSA